jgi:hypothetical protein
VVLRPNILNSSRLFTGVGLYCEPRGHEAMSTITLRRNSQRSLAPTPPFRYRLRSPSRCPNIPLTRAKALKIGLCCKERIRCPDVVTFCDLLRPIQKTLRGTRAENAVESMLRVTQFLYPGIIGFWDIKSLRACGALEVAAIRNNSPSKRKMNARSAPHSLTELSATVSNTA